MQPDSRHFKANAEAALREPNLQAALKQLELGFVAGRQRCYEALPEFESPFSTHENELAESLQERT